MKSFPKLSMTLGVSLRIKYMVAVPHATWPPGARWLVELIPWPLGFPLFFSFLGLKLPSPSFFPISLIRRFEFFFFFLFTCATVPTLFWRHPLDFLLQFELLFQGTFFFFSPPISFFFIICYKFLIFSFLFALLWLFFIFGFLGFNPFLAFHG